MQEVKIVGRGVDTLVINVCYANEHFQPVKQELAKGVQHELEFYFAQRRMKYINRLASHVPLQYNCLNNTSIMLFTNQDREWFVTLSTCASLSVNSAKGLARWAQRCFAALSMTGPTLVGTLHNRRSTVARSLGYGCSEQVPRDGFDQFSYRPAGR